MQRLINRMPPETAPRIYELLVVHPGPFDTRAIARALSPAQVHCRLFVNMRTALVDLFYTNYDLCLLDPAVLDEPDYHLLDEIQNLAPWRSFMLIEPDDAPDLAPAPKRSFKRISRGDTDSLAGHMRQSVQAADSTGLQAAQLNQLQQLFAVMRETVPNALKQPDMPGALEVFFSRLSHYLDLSLLGMASLDADNPFVFVQHGDEYTPGDIGTIRQAICDRLFLLSPDMPDSKMIFQPRPSLSAPGGPPAFSLLPIVYEGKLAAWLIISMAAPDTLKPLLFSCLVEVVNAMTMIFSTMHQLRSLALRDPLTQLYNRRYVEESAPRMISLAHRYGYNIAILFVDVDNFKNINDRRGHAAGDQALIHVARHLTSCLRQSDMIARYAGDEFLVILPHTSTIEARRTAGRLVEDVRNSPLAFQGEHIPLAISIGVTVSTTGAKGCSFDELVKRADEALRLAKTTGGNQAMLWTSRETDNASPPPDAPPLILPEKSHDGKHTAPCVLVVDDELTVLKYMERIIHASPYHAVVSSTPREAEELLQNHPGLVTILVTDVNMPGKNGFDLIRSVKRIDPSIVCIVMSSDVDPARAILAFRNGAYDILQKPFNGDQLMLALNRAQEYHETQEKNKRFQQDLLNIINLKSAEHRRSLEAIKSSFQFTLDTMVAMLDAREQYTSQHSIRVRDLTVLLARKMGFKPGPVKDIAQGALLHDIGKIGIADSILLKPAALTPSERCVMERHPAIGHAFLAPSDHLQQAGELVLSHHERWDGKGYPRNLKGEQIPVGARIFSVIDCYDAIRSKRVYKPARPADESLATIQANSGTHFDPEVVKLFSAHHAEIEELGAWARE